MINIGSILTARRLEDYPERRLAVHAMQKAGIDISIKQYKRLEDGGMPVNQQQMQDICDFYDLPVECWLFGKCHLSPQHCHIVADLSEPWQQVIIEMGETLAKQIQTKGWDITPNQPPTSDIHPPR